ncbi:chloride channel protein [Oecophyllibacter saccharovorans]|uniref:chloride channel protein n=1 Tax=Oecophyllibacter saccharovorans TaxID=2558360 RepID=UPI00116BC357|nr:chloride channel protein [Oecophyllibacter saccharovorans]TPW35281.1 chloride channel protein [Oecophyllibacter saccharovorans]
MRAGWKGTRRKREDQARPRINFARLRRRALVRAAPPLLRGLVRRHPVWLTLLAACVGALGGMCVVVVTRFTLMAHRFLYNLHNSGHLSALAHLPWQRCLTVLLLGGVAVGVVSVVASQLIRRPTVDPIEANALYGGRMSLGDSLVLVAQNTLSNSVGASIGLEAGFSQISSALGSWLGQSFRVRREDLRMLVGAGAAGAIGAALNAPLGGAFYAFELIIGTYCLLNLAPIAAAAIAGVGMVHLLGLPPSTELTFQQPDWHMGWRDVAGVAVLSIACTLSAIVIMWGVTQFEALFRRLPGPAWLRPVLGGSLVAVLAGTVSPAVLSSGHAAIWLVLCGKVGAAMALLLLGAKALATSLSVGSGFRGGLFFASLYLGALAGLGLGALLAPYGLAPHQPVVCAVLGMSAVGVAIIGGPMTMICLVLEMTDDAGLASGVVLAAILAFLTVKHLFGYNFSTWRFHLRGETILSAVDIGGLRSLSVQSLMRTRVRTLPAGTPLTRARALFPVGSGRRIVLVGEDGRYEGMVSIAELHAGPSSDEPVAILGRQHDTMLIPEMTARAALESFAKAEADVLVVVEDRLSRQVVGQLEEHYTLRRYAAELERSRRELAGEDRFPV